MVDKQELSSAGLKFMDFAIRFFNISFVIVCSTMKFISFLW